MLILPSPHVLQSTSRWKMDDPPCIEFVMNKQTETVLNYHNRTKHRLERYAKGPESIDWDDQPDQFRRFSGCEIVSLPKPGAELELLFTDLDNPEAISPKPVTLANAGLLLELAFGHTAFS